MNRTPCLNSPANSSVDSVIDTTAPSEGKRRARRSKREKKSNDYQIQNNFGADKNSTLRSSDISPIGKMKTPRMLNGSLVETFPVSTQPLDVSAPSTSKATTSNRKAVVTNNSSQKRQHPKESKSRFARSANGLVEEYLDPSTSRNMINNPIPSTSRVSRNEEVGNNSVRKGKSPKEKLIKYNYYLQGFENKKYINNNIWNAHVNQAAVKEDTQPSESENFDESQFHFCIKSIQNPSNGFFIRKRSPSSKYVNLNSFSSNISVFKSNFTIKTLDTTIEILNETLKNISLNQSTDLEETMAPKNEEETILPQKSDKKTKRRTKETSLSPTKEPTNVGSVLTETSSMETAAPKRKERKPKKVRLKVKKLTQKANQGNYPEYLSKEEMEEGLANGSLKKGFLRINQRNNKEAYVTNIVKGHTDYLIQSLIDQNRALDGDEVVLEMKPESGCCDGRKTSRVVYISKMVHSRTCVGNLRPLPKQDNFAAFHPRDNKFPMVHIPAISWPTNFKSNPDSFSKNLFVAKITDWTSLDFARGLIIEHLGTSGDLKIENLAILKTCGLDHEPFSNDVLKYLPRTDELQDSWLEGREDLRKECIFTIDPLTARDLDDAVSCKTLPDGNLEIGVHIADVTHFLKEGTELDKQVEWKATTIYMIDHVYHMLPVELCMCCSLLPGKDKLSFSVIWTMTPEGEILTTRFARTVMNSSVQLAYEHAQAIIDDPENFDAKAFPKIANGFTIDHIKNTVLKLYTVSEHLRNKRFENGALRIDQLKLSFDLDPITGFPIGYKTEQMKEANRLIEEFMLLANISVAEKIIDSFPEIAFLRMHEAPKESMLRELKTGLESIGIHVDITSAKSIQRSLSNYSSDDFLGKIRGMVLSHLFAKPMQRARYFCPALEKEIVCYGHYALNIPLYTHFTSPIRRYADIMVHRLLAASLGLTEKPSWDSTFVAEVAARCNLLKYNAKKAQEESSKLYFSLFISKNGPFVRSAAVVDVKDRSFDVLILDSGEILRVYLNDIEGAKSTLEEIPSPDLNSKRTENSKKDNGFQKKHWRIKLSFPQLKNSPAVELMIEIFTLVTVELKKCSKKRKLVAKLLRPTS